MMVIKTVSAIGHTFFANLTQRSLAALPSIKQVHTASYPLAFRATPCLMVEPGKRKRRIDPTITKEREERRQRRIRKQIKLREKRANTLKPIDELLIATEILDDNRIRKVTISEEIEDKRVLLKKDWARHLLHERSADAQLLDRIVFAQRKALDELRLESEELYQAALQIDTNFIPFKFEGPTETPPVDNYEIPDGDYTDISTKWE